MTEPAGAAAETGSTARTSAELVEALDPRTTSARLHRLTRSRSREVRRAVATNPNTALADLNVLARTFPNEFGDNPVIDWLTLTDAEWPNELSDVSRHRVLASTRSESMLWWAVNAGGDDDRLAAVTNPNCPIAILRLLAGSDESVAMVAAMHVAMDPAPSDASSSIRASAHALANEAELADLLTSELLPRWLVEDLGLPTDTDARRELARHRWANPVVLRELLGDDDEQTRRFANVNANTDPSDNARWDRLCADDDSLDGADLEVLASSSYGRERCAHHPRLPDESRRRCVTDSSWRIRQMAATNPALTPEEAAGLAVDGDRDVRAAIAGNPALPAGAALGLQMDTDERVRAVARSRDRPAGDAETLSATHAPLSAAARALLLASGNAHSPLDSLHRRGLARSADLTALTSDDLDRLAGDDDVQVRSALAENATAPNSLLIRLASDPDPLVRRRVAAIVNDEDTLAGLCADTSPDVQAGAARNPGLPPWLVLRLAETMADDVRLALATRARIGVDALARMLDRPVGDRTGVIVSNLVRHEDAGVQELVGDNPSSERDSVVEDVRGLLELHSWAALIALQSPSFPAMLLAALRSSTNWRIRQAVAAHPNTEIADLHVLASDHDNDVRAAVAANPSVAVDEFECFVTETDEKVRRSLVTRPDISVALLCVHLLGDDGIRAAALDHPRLPEEIRNDLVALLQGSPLGPDVLRNFVNTSARHLVVAHPSTSAALLGSVVDDPSWTIREAIARHPNCSPNDLRHLAEDQDRDVRAAVGGNVATPPDVLEVLSGDSDPRVRRAVLGNASWVSVHKVERSNSLARSLLRHESSIVRIVALLANGHDEAVLRRPRHVRSIDWLERFAVAVHPNTPLSVRDVLVGDANVHVRAAAKGELAWPRR